MCKPTHEEQLVLLEGFGRATALMRLSWQGVRAALVR